MELYVDADFAGQWGYEDKRDPSCVKSRTGYIIFISECPVLWVSKLQTEIALSTMESEYIALSTAMRDLLPMKTKVETIGNSLKIGQQENTKIFVQADVYEDNLGCLKLAQMDPGRSTPRSKHYAVKLHWFRSKLTTNIKLHVIKSEDQRADFLTKALQKVPFEANRKLSLGW